MKRLNPKFLHRIKYDGDIAKLLDKALELYDLGSLVEYHIIEVGYEDLNFRIETSEGIFFAKFFAQTGSFMKSHRDCGEYVRKISEAIKAGVRHPELFRNKEEQDLSVAEVDHQKFDFCVQEFIKTTNANPLDLSLNHDDLTQIGKSVAMLHKSNFVPQKYYDEWSVINFSKELDSKEKYLETPDKKTIREVHDKFAKVEINSLPHSFIHGDIIIPNILKSISGEISIIDFSVSNYGPRIVDLAILACDVTFTPENPVKSADDFRVLIDAYQESIKLTKAEAEALPLFIDGCHAMHVLLSSYEINSKEDFNDEDYYWRELGRKGLRRAGCGAGCGAGRGAGPHEGRT